MSDADLIYNACLRAERRIEERISLLQQGDMQGTGLRLSLFAIQTLREEVGTGMTRESR